MVLDKRGVNFEKMITEFTDEELDTFLRAFGDVATIKERQDQDELKKLQPKSELDQYMMGIDEDYDPDELEKRKKEYLRQQRDEEVDIFAFR